MSYGSVQVLHCLLKYHFCWFSAHYWDQGLDFKDLHCSKDVGGWGWWCLYNVRIPEAEAEGPLSELGRSLVYLVSSRLDLDGARVLRYRVRLCLKNKYKNKPNQILKKEPEWREPVPNKFLLNYAGIPWRVPSSLLGPGLSSVVESFLNMCQECHFIPKTSVQKVLCRVGIKVLSARQPGNL